MAQAACLPPGIPRVLMSPGVAQVGLPLGLPQVGLPLGLPQVGLSAPARPSQQALHNLPLQQQAFHNLPLQQQAQLRRMLGAAQGPSSEPARQQGTAPPK